VISHDGRTCHEIAADCIAVSGGWTPAVNLYSMAGGALRWDERASMFVPSLELPHISVVGACAGELEAGEVPADRRPSAAALSALGRRPGKVFVDLQNDVAESDVALAARENYRSVEHLKRYTTLGMATDQGKTSNVNALVLMGGHTQRTPPQVGTTQFRPFKPVTLNAIAGGRSGERIKPLKRMPRGMTRHVQQGARLGVRWLAAPGGLMSALKSLWRWRRSGRPCMSVRRSGCSKARRWARSRSTARIRPSFST
jgi:sarcosine oxidase subunit alpha